MLIYATSCNRTSPTVSSPDTVEESLPYESTSIISEQHSKNMSISDSSLSTDSNEMPASAGITSNFSDSIEKNIYDQLWIDNYEKYIKPILYNSEDFISSGFDYFITRKGNKLYNGDKEFRFVSFNAANLLYNCDDTFIIVSTENRRRSSPYEISDTIKTIYQTGGQVVRTQAFSVRQPSSARAIIKHIYGPGEFDELLFRDLDRIFAECNRYNVRIIIPLINPWPFYGSGADFDAVCGGSGTLASFYNNENTIARYKELLYYLANRTNYYTGIKYKDEKALLCWELGNEITAPSIIDVDRATPEWMNDIAAYLKEIDPNHLIMDGGVTNPAVEIIESPYIDILTTHYSPALSFPDKPTIHGEFDPTNGFNQSFIDYYMSKSSGMLAWNLDPHNKNGGFLFRLQDWKTPPLRWPGFITGMPDEAIQMALIRKNAYNVQGLSVPKLTVPEPPKLLPIAVPREIRWRGSTGADCYDIQRSDSPDGPFKTIASNVEDSQVPRFKPYSDKTAEQDKVYYYRVVAKNREGSSLPSNIVPCMPEILYADMEEEVYGKQVVDEMNTLSKACTVKGNIQTGPGKFGDPSAITFLSDTEIIYKTESTLKDYFLFIQWKNDAYMNIMIYLSADGVNYDVSEPGLVDYGKSDYNFGRIEKYPLKKSYKYIKIVVNYRTGLENELLIGRIELNMD